MSLDLELIENNITTLQGFMRDNSVDSFYISSFDPFLSEYVPLDDCHRYFLTGFTGSVAEVLCVRGGKTYLFVDGRYHEQADLEIKSGQIEVVKCQSNTSNLAELKNTIAKLKLNSIGIEGDRTSEAFFRDLESKLSVKSFDNAELDTILEFGKFESTIRLYYPENEEDWGGSTTEKLKRILNPGEAFYITALDSIAWISNIRGFEQPFQSTFMSKCLATYDHLYVFVAKGAEFKNVKHENTTIIQIENWSLKEGLLKVSDTNNIKKLYYDKEAMNHADYFALTTLVIEDKLEHLKGGIIEFHSVKNNIEMNLIRDAFDKGDQAIFDTIKKVKEIIKSGETFSELDFFNLANQTYKDGGAIEQSFNTISGVGANASIIHFGNPSASRIVEESELLLFDSGAFYEGGFATDTTRTFLSSGTPLKWQKEIYTLVLQGLLQSMNAVFPEGTLGSQIDMLARQPILKNGYNYAHGTGHGVGINVHESGFRISPLSTVPLVKGKIGSIEPGIYLPGKGGVRLENIYEVISHPKFDNMLTFKPLVYIGFEEILIDFNMLSKEEIAWLDEYESECVKRKRSMN